MSVLTPELGRRAVLLLSGGIDSAALAALTRPAWTLAVDYGQRPAAAELRAARAVATHLGLRFAEIRVDLSPVGSGLLLGDESPDDRGRTDAGRLEHPDAPEWWPYRNQLLVTVAAAWVHSAGADGPMVNAVFTASVSSDGARHVDGTADFYDALDRVMRIQEGGVRVAAPAIGYSTTDLVREIGCDEALLGWTHSCHRSNAPCTACPGCYKRDDVLTELGILGHRAP